MRLSCSEKRILGNLSALWELIRRERRAEASYVMEYSFLPSFLPFPQALRCGVSCCVLLTEEMLIHGSELQETLFPGEETSLVVLPAPSLPAAATCPALGLHPGHPRRDKAHSSLASEVTFPGPAPHEASLGLSALTLRYLFSPSPLLSARPTSCSHPGACPAPQVHSVFPRLCHGSSCSWPELAPDPALAH